MAEIPALFGQRPIVHRHQKAAMYHPFVEGYVFHIFLLYSIAYIDTRLALTLVDLPLTFLTSIIFGILLYFLVGLQLSAGQFL